MKNDKHCDEGENNIRESNVNHVDTLGKFAGMSLEIILNLVLPICRLLNSHDQ